MHLIFLTRARIYSKGGKVSDVPSENLGTYSKPKCSILLLSLQRNSFRKLRFVPSSHLLKKETLNLEDG